MLQGTLFAIACIWLIAGCTAVSAAAPDAKWRIGAPIVTYWAGPGGFMPVNDKTAEQIHAGGWNLAWATKPEELDIYHRHGLRAMLVIGTPNVDDPAQAKALDELIGVVKDHPALYAYHLTDEPGAGAFPGLGKLVAYLRERDPAHLAYINLFPTYANEAQLGVSADKADRAKVGIPSDFAGANTDEGTVIRYREHLRQFVEIVKPDLISYDHYHFLKNSDGAQYFLNLALIRKAALEAKKPFLNIIQACDSPAEGWRGPGENELRWLTYTSLAYGAQGISHFRYDIGLWKDPSEATTPLPLYWAVSQFNREFLAIATELQPLKSLAVYHCGTMPIGGVALPAGSIFRPEPASQEVLLGYFGKSADSPTHAVLVNLDYKRASTSTLVGPGRMDLFHASTGTWSDGPVGKRVRLELPPGGGALVRLKK